MTNGTFPVGNVLKTYTKAMKDEASKGQTDTDTPRAADAVSISLEGKKRQIMTNTTRNIIEKVKETR